ncbi:hypothetical protein IFM89_020248 [Coptis chinensis]|uniref:Transposase MuDR plant domain-containing protein n=1 Tax=Coptis chinensis TaxID=261450 RepID=A0A835LVZ6_9MAGN|nr:hypothetical protein IFM89_020248 [Coptis chinensis]
MTKVSDPVEASKRFGTCELKHKMTWATVENCREFFQTMAIKHKFSTQQVRNDRERYILACKDPSCEWTITATLTRKNMHTFVLRNYNDEHTCEASVKNKFTQARAPWVAQALENKMREHLDYRPKDIQAEIVFQYGVSISYWIGWNARTLIFEVINGNYEGYRLVPEMCRQIIKSNPSSFAKHFVNEKNQSFIGVVVAFKSSLDGWLNGCRPIVGLDGCFLKGKCHEWDSPSWFLHMQRGEWGYMEAVPM